MALREMTSDLSLKTPVREYDPGVMGNIITLNVGEQYGKFNLKADSHNSGLIPQPYILHGIQIKGVTTPLPTLIDSIPGVRSTEDVLRIGQFLASGRGKLFIISQFGLQRMQAVNNPIIRTYNLGVNTIAAVRTKGSGIHPKRHGNLPLDEDIFHYEKATKLKELAFESQNRLIKLTNEVVKPRVLFSTRIASLSNPGGPNSFLGIGYTDYNISDLYLNYRTKSEELLIDKGKYVTLAYDMIPKEPQKESDDFRKLLPHGNKLFGSGTKDWNQFNATSYFGLPDSGKKANRSDIKTRISADEINLLGPNEEPSVQDYVIFNFRTPTGEMISVFRSTFDGFTDSFSPEWNTINMIGRADPVFRYTGFGTRSFSFSFKIITTSRDELIQNYKRLNELQGYTAPEYTDTGMVSPFMKLTIGDYLKEVPGFLNSLEVQADNDTPWEINLEGDIKQLPHFLTISVGYTIVSDHLPQRKAVFISAIE